MRLPLAPYKPPAGRDSLRTGGRPDLANSNIIGEVAGPTQTARVRPGGLQASPGGIVLHYLPAAKKQGHKSRSLT